MRKIVSYRGLFQFNLCSKMVYGHRDSHIKLGFKRGVEWHENKIKKKKLWFYFIGVGIACSTAPGGYAQIIAYSASVITMSLICSVPLGPP